MWYALEIDITRRPNRMQVFAVWFRLTAIGLTRFIRVKLFVQINLQKHKSAWWSIVSILTGFFWYFY